MDVFHFNTRLRILQQGGDDFSVHESSKGYISISWNTRRLIRVHVSDDGRKFRWEDSTDWLSENELIAKLRGKSVPEPPPQPKGVVVPDALIAHLQQYHHQDLCNLIRQRDAFGRAKYGQPLMSQDGRNGVEDARQEAGDLLQYAFKVHLAGDKEGLKALVELTKAVAEVVATLADK